MLQNKIYQNFLLEILKNFFSILFVFSLIALTVRAVNFLDLIVDNGYPVSIYFFYSTLNLFGLAPKFIPLSFLIALLHACTNSPHSSMVMTISCNSASLLIIYPPTHRHQLYRLVPVILSYYLPSQSLVTYPSLCS